MPGFVRRLLSPEKRDVQFSPSLSVMLANMTRGSLAAAGVRVTSQTALRMMAVRACVRVISEDIASLPLIVYRRLPARGKERATDYPLYSILHDAPNPEMTSFQFRETMMLAVLTSGNAFAEVVYTNGRPSQLWPITPSRVTVRRENGDQGALAYYVQPPGGPSVRIPASRMFHLRGLSSNGIWGLSPIEDARDAIGLGMAGEQFASGFFVNGMKPSVVYEHPGVLSEAAYERLSDNLAQQQIGLTNAQRVAILEEGMKANTLAVSPEDAQFIEQRKFAVEEIARLYRVHPHKIGVMEGTQTYASVEQANIDHVVSTIRPWAVRWEQQIAASLIPAEDDRIFAELLFDGLLRGDTKTRYEAYQIGRQNGWLSSNDIRELENQNPIDGGDVYWRPANMEPADMPVETAPPNGRSNGHRKETTYAFAYAQ